MKKLKLEELEVNSLTTSLQNESADEVKGGTSAVCGIGLMSIAVTAVGMTIMAFGGGGGASY